MNEIVGYNLPSTLKDRACGFGIGERFQTPQLTRDCKWIYAYYWYSISLILYGINLILITIFKLLKWNFNNKSKFNIIITKVV